MPDQDNNRVGYSHAFPQHEIDRADNPAALISEILRTLIGELLKKYPAADLTTLRFDLPEHPGLSGYRTARVRAWLKPADPDECPSCHAHAGHAHTDYCQAPRRSHVIADEIQHDDRPNLLEHLDQAIDRARANGDRTTPPLAAARSIHPDRGPVCRVEGAAQCRHVYESECTGDCGHTHGPAPAPFTHCQQDGELCRFPDNCTVSDCIRIAADGIPVHRCTDPTCPVDGPHAHAGTDLLMRHPWCTCHYLQAWRTWSVEPHREGCPLPDLPPSPSTPPTP